MQFQDFIGNEKIKEQLTYLTEAGRLPHAIVLEGEEGLGKRTLARELALALLCRGEDERPCRRCAQCSKVLKGIHPDVFEYSAEGGPRSFHVSVVRDVKESVFMQPNEADYKVYILGNCQCMSDSAQNALLKVLEEPPSYAVFILTVTNQSALLETVLSRSVVMKLEGVESHAAADYICRREEAVSPDEALQAVQAWNGNIGKALQSLSDGRYAKISSIAASVAEASVGDYEYDLIKACSVLAGDRESMLSVLRLLKNIYRDALAQGSQDLLSGQADTVQLVAAKLTRAKLVKLCEVCDELRALGEKNANNALMITRIPYELRRAMRR